MIDLVIGTLQGIRDRAVLLVLLDTLIRVSELVGLDAEDVDLDEGVIQVMGKGGKERRVPQAGVVFSGRVRIVSPGGK